MFVRVHSLVDRYFYYVYTCIVKCHNIAVFLVVEDKNKCSIVYADIILAFPVTCKILQCFVNQNAKEKNGSFRIYF